MAHAERLYALLSGQGTACLETTLREREFTTDERERVEREAERDTISDPAIPGTWTDVSGNPVCQEAE